LHGSSTSISQRNAAVDQAVQERVVGLGSDEGLGGLHGASASNGLMLEAGAAMRALRPVDRCLMTRSWRNAIRAQASSNTGASSPPRRNNSTARWWREWAKGGARWLDQLAVQAAAPGGSAGPDRFQLVENLGF
jgi:hypothetical protein